MLKQVLAVTGLNLSNLRSRLGVSTIVVVGVGGVVAVLLGLLAMSSGFRAALVETARPDRALIVRNGSNNEMDGWVTAEEHAILAQYEGIDVASGETYATISLPLHGGDGATAHAVARGVSAAAFRLRPELRIVRGRAFQPGKDEIIVGVGAVREYEGLDVGDRIEARNATLTVVGQFSAEGTAVESELWMDLPIAQDIFRRQGVVSVVRARLEAGASFGDVGNRIAADPRLPLTLVPESEFFAEQSASRAALIETFAYLIAGVMALGSAATAINVMYTAVSRRSVEIATLRALGFGSSGVVTSVIVEAMLLATLGGLIGAAIVYFALDGYSSATFNNASGSELAFAFRLTPKLIGVGLLWALGLGLVGGLLPAIRASRLPIARVLVGE